MHALEDQFVQLQAHVENALHYASLPTSPAAYQGQAGSSAAAQQQQAAAAQYPQQGAEEEDPAFMAYQAKVRGRLPFGRRACAPARPPAK